VLDLIFYKNKSLLLKNLYKDLLDCPSGWFLSSSSCSKWKYKGRGGCRREDDETKKKAKVGLFLILDREVQLELCRQLVFRVQSVGEVHSADSAVGMDLNPESLDVVGAIGAAGKVRQVELDLVPAVIQSHWHGADEGLDSCRALVIASTETPPNILVIQHLNFKCEIFLQVLDDHNKERQFDAKRFLGICWACDVCGTDICSHNF